MDYETRPTIFTAIAYFVFLLACASCLYLFLLSVAGDFSEPQPQRKPWEISTSQGRDHTSGHGYWIRAEERKR